MCEDNIYPKGQTGKHDQKQKIVKAILEIWGSPCTAGCSLSVACEWMWSVRHLWGSALPENTVQDCLSVWRKWTTAPGSLLSPAPGSCLCTDSAPPSSLAKRNRAWSILGLSAAACWPVMQERLVYHLRYLKRWLWKRVSFCIRKKRRSRVWTPQLLPFSPEKRGQGSCGSSLSSPSFQASTLRGPSVWSGQTEENRTSCFWKRGSPCCFLCRYFGGKQRSPPPNLSGHKEISVTVQACFYKRTI